MAAPLSGWSHSLGLPDSAVGENSAAQSDWFAIPNCQLSAEAPLPSRSNMVFEDVPQQMGAPEGSEPEIRVVDARVARARGLLIPLSPLVMPGSVGIPFFGELLTGLLAPDELRRGGTFLCLMNALLRSPHFSAPPLLDCATTTVLTTSGKLGRFLGSFGPQTI